MSYGIYWVARLTEPISLEEAAIERVRPAQHDPSQNVFRKILDRDKSIKKNKKKTFPPVFAHDKRGVRSKLLSFRVNDRQIVSLNKNRIWTPLGLGITFVITLIRV